MFKNSLSISNFCIYFFYIGKIWTSTIFPVKKPSQRSNSLFSYCQWLEGVGDRPTDLLLHKGQQCIKYAWNRCHTEKQTKLMFRSMGRLHNIMGISPFDSCANGQSQSSFGRQGACRCIHGTKVDMAFSTMTGLLVFFTKDFRILLLAHFGLHSNICLPVLIRVKVITPFRMLWRRFHILDENVWHGTCCP